MTIEQYTKELEKLSKETSKLTKKKAELRERFIESNKPCNIGDKVKVVTNGGRTLFGEARGFSINQNKVVFVDSIKPDGSNMVYLSVAHKSIDII